MKHFLASSLFCCVSLWQNGTKIMKEQEERLYVYPHMLKTGGTALSLLLGLTSRTVCGSRISSKYNVSDAMCQSGLLYGEKQEQYNSYTRLITRQREFMNKEEDIKSKPWVAFGHFSYSLALSVEHAIRLFPSLHQSESKTKFLLLLREPLNHRLSLFNARFAGSRLFSTFGEWIRSKEYIQESQECQLRAYRPLGESAEQLAANKQIAWIGVTERWLQSICALSLMLERDHGITFDRIPLWALKARAQTLQVSDFSPQDFAHFASLEAREMLFVQFFERQLESAFDVVPDCLIPYSTKTQVPHHEFIAAKLLDTETKVQARRSIRRKQAHQLVQHFQQPSPFLTNTDRSADRQGTAKLRQRRKRILDIPSNLTSSISSRRKHQLKATADEEQRTKKKRAYGHEAPDFPIFEKPPPSAHTPSSSAILTATTSSLDIPRGWM